MGPIDNLFDSLMLGGLLGWRKIVRDSLCQKSRNDIDSVEF